MSAYTEAWLMALLLTQLVEVPIYIRAAQGRGWAPRVLIAITPSFLTHPAVWFVFPDLMANSSYELYFVVAEGFAVGVEALFLRLVGIRRALGWSLLANAASVAVGMATRALFDWP